jgi:valyl-tRNA synthetase
MNVHPSKKINAIFVTADKKIARVLKEGGAFIERLASVQPITVKDSKESIPNDAVVVVASEVEVFLPFDQLVDVEKEMARLKKEKESLLSEVKRAEAKLGNPGFTSKAPQKVIDEERDKLAKYRDMLEKVTAGIERLG